MPSSIQLKYHISLEPATHQLGLLTQAAGKIKIREIKYIQQQGKYYFFVQNCENLKNQVERK